MNREKILIVIAGPTAAGKTAAAVELAKQLKTEIISADSRQFYREISIGTAKPTLEELSQAKHYFINSHSIQQNFSVGDFEREGLAVLEDIFKTHDTAIMAGGSGLYINAICKGFDDLPSSPPKIRASLQSGFEQNGVTWLQEKLKACDPGYYAKVDLNNPHRLIRALEVFESTGKPFSFFRKAETVKRNFRCFKIGLNLPREVLYERINSRVDDMITEGLVEEARLLYPHRKLNALNTVGYSELFDYFDGKADLETAVALIKQNTRRFAKRQLTWFKKDNEIHWMAADDPQLLKNILAKLPY
ncbi:MAG: tRNA (adenosine(37)-N6)-dimethylallyltransferase MiaA [Bacteroidetes bacterium]|nr:tRNA (adenosine(37)-N6)-dimethylallyltransferase MiaA [Bacteroidota bacterium]